MNKRIKITSARKGSVVYENNDKTPFWIRHPAALILVGGPVLLGVILALAVPDWGRGSPPWIGLAFGIAITVFVAIDAMRSLRAGEPRNVWVGELLSA